MLCIPAYNFEDEGRASVIKPSWLESESFQEHHILDILITKETGTRVMACPYFLFFRLFGSCQLVSTLELRPTMWSRND
jgi:hypothetical protein